MTIEQTAVNAIRILSADAVQKANSGHPGFPLGAAPIIYELFANHLTHNPNDPSWFNRDRFILSAGHGSAMLYSLLYLFGYPKVTIDELKNFRQLNSLTPGHPEYGHTAGVEATTGPLGAGLGMAVGMAMAEAHLASRYNRDGFKVADHYTYALCGDGCLMEGISSEVMSLAGTLKLGRLIVLYDSNSITIEGSTGLAFTEDVTKRFEAYNFQVLTVADGTDTSAIGRALDQARAEKNRPSFIKITTKIGYGVPAKEGKASAHGEPLGAENVAALRNSLKWPLAEAFAVSEDILSHYRSLAKKGMEAESRWNDLYSKYREAYPDLAEQLRASIEARIPEDTFADETSWVNGAKAEATRNISGRILNEVKEKIPFLMGGSADLAPSNKTLLSGVPDFSASDYSGRNIHFGVRELGMTAIGNGLILHGGVRAYVATFFVFADYMKPMLRLSALMGLPLISVFSHDSIGVGEDGPTHQAVEQLASLRATPNMVVFRPADEIETRAAWKFALTSKSTPVSLVLSRQNLRPLAHSNASGALKGGYILEKENGDKPEVILIATGSEVDLAVTAKGELEGGGHSVRVVSMPSVEVFESQDDSYKAEILPRDVRARVVIEAGVSASWGSYAGLDGAYVTLDTFGESAPADKLFEKYGFTVKNIVETVNRLIKR
ncbi:MAG: transketolase [Synergistaceae bacterium]|jgi:transketolase|nr:transketolase [Synergistaceae bacterium]